MQTQQSDLTRPPTGFRQATAIATHLTKDDIKALVASLRDITTTLAAADPTDKAAVYEEMGIDVTYHRDGRVLVESRPRVVNDGVGGASTTPSTRHPWEAWLIAA